MSYGYSGNLKGFLVTPVYEEAVDTLEEIVASTLHVELTILGEEVESYMAESPDPLISQIWKRKEPVGYKPFDYQRVGAFRM